MDYTEKLHECMIKLHKQEKAVTKCCIKEFGMSEMKIKDFTYLDLISNNKNLTTTTMANILKITKPSVTEIINKLIKQKFVYKEPSAEDGRVFYIKLTEKGDKIANFEYYRSLKQIEGLKHLLSKDEILSMINILNKVIASYDQKIENTAKDDLYTYLKS